MWTGGGAAALGLSGEITGEGIVRLLEGRDPESELLIRRPGGKDSIAAFDLTFRTPKSVRDLRARRGELAAQPGRSGSLSGRCGEA